MDRDRLPKGPAKGPAASGVSDVDELGAMLHAHPDLLGAVLDRHPELLARLTPPVRRSDGVIDLQSFLLARLRREVDRLNGQQRAIVAASRANQNSLSRIHTAILFLLDAESFEQLIQTITTDLAVLLDVDVACLVVESNGTEPPHALRVGLQLVDQGFVEHRLGKRAMVLEGDIVGEEEIYGAGAGLVRSQAMMRVNVSESTPPVMLALGSRDPDQFQTGLRTELLAFLAGVLERCIRTWLELPE